VLGYFWSMLHPLMLMIILATVFSNIMNKNAQDYAVFLFCGILPWQFFSGTAQGSLDSIRGNMRIINQVPIPKFIFCLSNTFSELINFLLSILPLILLMVFLGTGVSWTVLALPIVLLPLFLTTVGLALIFSASNVFFDDTKHLSTLFFRALFYLTPILYGREDMSDQLVSWLVLNPMFYIVENVRAIFYYGQLPDPFTYTVSVLTGLFILALGLWIFKKADDKFVYFV